MSAQTQLPDPPENWERVREGSPLIERADDVWRFRLQWCPICGPTVQFSMPGVDGSDGLVKIDQHIANHRPEQFGLSSRSGDRGLEEFDDEEEVNELKQMANDLEDRLGDVVDKHGTTGEPKVNKDLIRMECDVGRTDANAVRSLLEKRHTKEELGEYI